jgi:methyl-accepting chemotaxis protein
MSGGDIAGLIAAGVFALLVLLLAVPILKLGSVLEEIRTSIRSISDGATPLMDEVTATVTTTNQQLKKVDGIASNVSDASANLSALSSLIAATMGSPLIKVAAFSYGVRTALANRKKPAAGRRSR